MNAHSIRARTLTAALAIVMALGTSVAVAQDGINNDSHAGDSSSNAQACSQIGCNNGDRLCGYVSWSEWFWIWTPWVSFPWQFRQSATCYEIPMEM